MENGRAGRKGDLATVITLVMAAIIAIAVLFFLLGGIFPLIRVIGVDVPTEALVDMKKSYVVSSCSGWLDSGALEISYNPKINDAQKSADLGWDEFCSPDAIRDNPMMRCTCAKACTKAVSADKKCQLNPNIFKPDLFTHSTDDPEKGTISTSFESREGVSRKFAASYCALDFLKSLSEIDRTCRPESETAGLIVVQIQLEYSKPIADYGTLTPIGSLRTITGDPFPNINEVKVTCRVTCRVPGGCDGTTVSVNYGCKSYRPYWASLNSADHCCERSITSYPGSVIPNAERTIPVSTGRCLGSAGECGSIENFRVESSEETNAYSSITFISGDGAKALERFQIVEPAQTCDHIAEGESCSKEFTIRALDEVFDVDIGGSLRGAHSLENNALYCKAVYQGDDIFSTREPPVLTVLAAQSAYYAYDTAPGNVYKNFLCINEDENCNAISQSQAGARPGTPYDMSAGNLKGACG